jgi:hypothetical protein
MSSRWSFSLVFALWMNMLLPSAAPAQGIPFAVGGENVESESSIMPFQVKFRGILNATARGKSLGRGSDQDSATNRSAVRDTRDR